VFVDIGRRVAPLESALNAVGEVSGVNDLGRAGDDIAGGHPIRGGIAIAMALPGVGAEGRLGVKAARYADDLAVAFHHAWPKYLGGAHQQLLEVLPREVHSAYHSGLDKILPRQAGGGYYQSLSRAQLRQVYRDFEAYTRAFDREYGSRLWEAARREGFR